MVERSAVNRLVVGSNPTSGAISMFWVYVLENAKGQFYIGHTDDLANRIAKSQSNRQDRGKFTRKNGPWTIRVVGRTPKSLKRNATEREIKNWKSARLIRDRLVNTRRSSVVESRRIGINRLVVGSNPTSGVESRNANVVATTRHIGAPAVSATILRSHESVRLQYSRAGGLRWQRSSWASSHRRGTWRKARRLPLKTSRTVW